MLRQQEQQNAEQQPSTEEQTQQEAQASEEATPVERKYSEVLQRQQEAESSVQQSSSEEQPAAVPAAVAYSEAELHPYYRLVFNISKGVDQLTILLGFIRNRCNKL